MAASMSLIIVFVLYRSSVLFHVSCMSDVFVQSLCALHVLYIWSFHGVTFSIIDLALFLILRSMVMKAANRFSSLRSYRKVMHDINTR